MKLLYFGESPAITTGLSQVTRTILDAIHPDIDVEVIAMNHFLSDYDHDRFPYTIHPCVTADWRNEHHAKDCILNGEYDVFMYSADVGFNAIFDWLREARAKRQFLTIAYCPVDCDIISPETFECFSEVDVIVTYTEHAKSVIERYRPELAGKISVIYLACEPALYHPLSAEKRRQVRKDLYGIDDSTFVVGSVNRNQHRKDLGRLLAIFHEFHQTHSNSMLYLHCQQNDMGGCIPAMAHSMGMELGKEVVFTNPNFNILQGFSEQTMNDIYNSFDCLASTSTGEGWGLSTTCAMAACTPVVVPNNTAFTEIVGTNEERGYLVRTGGDVDHRIFLYGMANYPRDIVHSHDFLEKLGRVYFRPHEARAKAIEARRWTEQHTTAKIGDQWKQLFSNIGQLTEVMV